MWVRIVLVWFFAIGIAAADAGAQTLASDDGAIERRIEQLEAQTRQLRDELRESRLNEQRSAADALRQEADRRSQPLDMEGFTAGYSDDRGFLLQSADGRFVLHPWLQLQVRGVVNSRKADAAWDDQSGFEIRRMYFAADGNAFSPDLTYSFIFAANRHNGTPEQLDAWAAYHLPQTPFTLKGGQFLNPFDHESLTYSRWQLAAERSLTGDVLAGGDDYVQGVQLGYDNSNDIRAYFAFTDGFNNNNKNFQDFPVNKANFGFAGRAEYKAAGQWKQYRDFTALGDTTELLVFGAGFDYTEAGHQDALRHVVDVQYENPCGFSAFAAYLGRFTLRGGTNGQDTYDPSVRVQAAMLLTRDWEPFARYDYFHLDGRELPAGVAGNVHELTLGTNYYLHSFRAKFTLDFTYLPTGTPVADDASDVLSTGAAISKSSYTHGGGSEFIGRAQFQLVL